MVKQQIYQFLFDIKQISPHLLMNMWVWLFCN